MPLDNPGFSAALNKSGAGFTNKSLTGFTILELLVVTAIIALLVSIVMTTVKQARFQAKDAVIQSRLHEVRNAAELSFSGVENYSAVCDEVDNTLNNSGTFYLLEWAIKENNSNRNVACYESSDKKEFAVSSPLISKSGKCWCAESAGVSVELDCLAINSSRCVCP